MKTFTSLILLVLCFCLSAQNAFNLSFTGTNNGEYVMLDSILIKNMDQSCDTLLVWPDTSLQLLITGAHLPEERSSKMKLTQNYPNPFKEQSSFRISVPEKTAVDIIVSGMSGRNTLHEHFILQEGEHTFRFTAGKEKINFLRVLADGREAAIKMVSLQQGDNSRVEYIGYTAGQEYKSGKEVQEFNFSPGDELLFIAYNALGESGELKMLEDNYACTLQFASNIPCPSLDSLLYEDQWYSTIQVFNQCWFRENLNVGEKILSTDEQTDNNLIEKYCFINNLNYCDAYGGLYCWDEMMAHSSTQQGICPEGWHVPTDMDWKILEGAVDSEYGIGDFQWNTSGWRGTDAGANLKEAGTEHWWEGNTGTDAFSFTALPAGYFVDNDFWGLEYRAVIWSSDPPDNTIRQLDAPESGVKRIPGSVTGNEAFSVRCLKD